jgi:hypothetical protein
VNFSPELMSRAELESGFQSLVEELYSAEFTKERRSHYRQQLRASRTSGGNPDSARMTSGTQY